jgi:hypothetical protein
MANIIEVTSADGLARELDRALPGDVILLRAGLYKRQQEVNRPGITVQAYKGEKAVVQPVQGLTGDTYCFRVNASNTSIRDLVLFNSYGYSSCAVYLVAGSGHQITGNEMGFHQDSAIFVENVVTDCDISRNWIHDSGWNHMPTQHQSHGIYIEGAGHRITCNVIQRTPEGYGIQAYPTLRDTVIAGNTIIDSHPGKASIVVGGSNVYNVYVFNNVLYYGVPNTANGIKFTGRPHDCKVGKNLIFGNTKADMVGSGYVIDGANIHLNPLLASYPSSLSLLPSSPGVNAADPRYVYSPAFDGTSRPQGAASDIGAYELAELTKGIIA